MASPRCAPAHARSGFSFSAKAALAALAGVLAAWPATAQQALSLALAQRIALEQSSKLPAQEQAAMAARDMAVAAGRLPDPVLKIGIDNLPLGGPGRFRLNDDTMTMRRVGLMQELTRAGKRRLRAERFERDAELALAEKTVAVVEIELETARAWLERHYAEAMAAAVAEQDAQARLELLAAEGAYRAGAGSQADVFAARGALSALDDRASELERRVGTAGIMLARWVGDAAGMPLDGPPAMDRIALDPATLEARLAGEPRVALLGRQEDIAATEARLAQEDKKADWSVEVSYQQRGPTYPNMVSVGLSVPLQWDRRNRQDRELSSRRALLEKARAERQDALRAQVARTRALIGEWRNGRERHERYARELIPLAAQRTAAMLAAYRGGKARLMDVLGARRDETELRLKALELEAGTAQLWAQLSFLFPSGGSASRPGAPASEVSE